MDPMTWQRIEALFFQALDRAPDERAAFLEAASADAPEIRREVEEMLAAHSDDARLGVEHVLVPDDADRVDRPDDQPISPAAADSAARAGQRVGAWRIERLLGQGGMGEVWYATRADGAYDLPAALKLVRPGFRAAQLIPRFLRERQLLARLQHPNISTLLDGGVTPDGRPYLVMEYVKGEPVTAWCATRRLGVRDRLRLFRTICDAVQFAHSKLVAHRDLKPQNILVTEDGRPILLDFGIAKLLDPELDEGLTRAEERLLTPEHAAPEQIRGEPTTTATDVWALGVLLYELLAGRRPFVSDLTSPARIEDVVQREDPPLPSTRALSREAARASRGDLDRIVMKALRKEPERRYGSAEELGEDVDRWLGGRPVRAVPDSPTYRLRKMVRRHRAPLAVGAVIACLLIGSTVLAVWQARRVAAERDAAVAAREDVDQAVAILVDLFAVANPRIMPGGDSLRVDDLLSLAEENLEASTESPRVQAKLWLTLADIHGVRSRYDEKDAALARALDAATRAGLDDDVLAIEHERARMVLLREGPAAAEPLLRASLARHEARYGPDAPDVASAAQDLATASTDAGEQRALLERALAITERGLARGRQQDSLDLASALNGLGTFYWQHGDWARAVDTFEETHDLLEKILSPDHPHVLTVRSNLAIGLEAIGRFREAESTHRELLAARRRVLGDEAGGVAASLLNVGHCLVHAGRHDEAVPYLDESVALAERVYGPDHATTARSALDLAIALVHTERADEAFAVYDRGEAVLRSAGVDEAEHLDLATRRMWLELWADRPVSVDSVRVSVDRMREVESVSPVALAGCLRLLGAAALRFPERSQRGEAEAAFREAIALLDGRVAESHPSTALARCGVEIARAQDGLPVDRAALASALPLCETWGLTDARLMRRGRELLTAAR